MSKLQRFLSASPIDKLNVMKRLYRRLVTKFWYGPQFKIIGTNTHLETPLLISNPQFISLGSHTSIRRGVRLEVIQPFPKRTPQLSIGDHVNIEQNVHIVCHSRVSIGSFVSITANCAIVDVTHPYLVVGQQPPKIGEAIVDEDSFVEIGEGAFIGVGTVILPNVRIGARAVIGANSVVTQDIPPFCVAAGIPAKVIRSYATGGQ